MKSIHNFDLSNVSFPAGELQPAGGSSSLRAAETTEAEVEAEPEGGEKLDRQTALRGRTS